MSPMTDPTRDEAVRSLIERYDAAMACQKESPDASLIVMANYGDLAINHLRAMLDSAPAPASGGVEAVKAEIARLRPHYQSGSMLDVGRRQMLDHFEKLIVGLATQREPKP